MEIYRHRTPSAFSSFPILLSSQIHETAGCEAHRNAGEIYYTFIDRFRRHTELALATAFAISRNIKFYVAGVANVPRMWIDRCIKQPSKPISIGTNASKGRFRVRAGKTLPHIMCVAFSGAVCCDDAHDW